MWILIAKVLAPFESIHYASEASTGPFRHLFGMNLRLEKPCAVIKGTKWLRNYAYLIWKSVLWAIPPFIWYLLHHNFEGPLK
jgi:hypothetical protein